MVYYPRDVPTEHESSNCLFHVSDWIPTLLSMHNEAKGMHMKNLFIFFMGTQLIAFYLHLLINNNLANNIADKLVRH